MFQQAVGAVSGTISSINEAKYSLFSKCAKCVSYRRYTKSLTKQDVIRKEIEDDFLSEKVSSMLVSFVYTFISIDVSNLLILKIFVGY